jgi:CRP/FNR family transcriptional regulator
MENLPNFESFLKKHASEEWSLVLNNYVELKSYKKNEIIIMEGKPLAGLYFINHGKIKVSSLYEANQERIMRLSNTGDFVGHRALFSDQSPISATALTDAELIFIPKNIFMRFISANPHVALFFIKFISMDLFNTEERMKSMIHHEVIVRVANIICMLIDVYGYSEKDPKKLEYMLARKDIASFAGTTYESVIRNLANLDELELIKIDNKNIIVPNEDALRKFISKSTN